MPEGRWRAYDYADLIARGKASLDIFWLKAHALADSDKLPSPAVIAQEIADDLEAALEQFRLIAADMGVQSAVPKIAMHSIAVHACTTGHRG